MNICINSLKKERQEANIKGEGGRGKITLNMSDKVLMIHIILYIPKDYL